MKRVVIRKQKDGINHEAVIIDDTHDYPLRYGSGYTKSDALNDLVSSLKTEIYMLEQDLDLALHGKIEVA